MNIQGTPATAEKNAHELPGDQLDRVTRVFLLQAAIEDFVQQQSEKSDAENFFKYSTVGQQVFANLIPAGPKVDEKSNKISRAEVERLMQQQPPFFKAMLADEVEKTGGRHLLGVYRAGASVVKRAWDLELSGNVNDKCVMRLAGGKGPGRAAEAPAAGTTAPATQNAAATQNPTAATQNPTAATQNPTEPVSTEQVPSAATGESAAEVAVAGA